MQKRVLTVAIVGILGVGALAAAQAPPFTVQADRTSILANVTWGPGAELTRVGRQTVHTGNVVLQVNGVVVRADRAVITDGEVALEGNVRLTLPATK